jgi:hypothetical protein
VILLRCPHAPTCRVWVKFPTPTEAAIALAKHLVTDHEPSLKETK